MEQVTMDFYYREAWRMDWALGNPNKTATLSVCLMISVWMIAYKWREGFWVALPIFGLLGLCLVQTYSRGGMVALLGGVAVLLVWTPRPWPVPQWIAAVASIWIVGFFIIYSEAETRYSQGLFSEDPSINSRLIIWKHFPEMLAAAPWGWGWGNAGDAYTQWFQPVGQSVNYLNLINSHLTWMVEGGWVASVAYVNAWMIVLLLCWPSNGSTYRAVPLAVWCAFGISGCFTHVEETIELWIIPLLVLGCALWSRFKLRKWPSQASVGLSSVLALGILTITVLTGFAEASLSIVKTGRAVTVGSGSKINVILVDRNVMGKLYGHSLRRFLEKDSEQLSRFTFVISESRDIPMPLRLHELVVSGRLCHDVGYKDVNKADQVILVNPDSFLDLSKWGSSNATKTCVYFGEYSQSPARSSWASYPGIKSLLIEGAADYVPGWPEAVLARPPNQSSPLCSKS